MDQRDEASRLRVTMRCANVKAGRAERKESEPPRPEGVAGLDLVSGLKARQVPLESAHVRGERSAQHVSLRTAQQANAGRLREPHAHLAGSSAI
eukprot:scaffold60194_cov67-Phaeocystis_antarctica.AAC.3